MIQKSNTKIFYLNRYDLHKPKNVRDFSGYEHVVKQSNQFVRIKPKYKMSKIIFFFLKKHTPLNYLKQNYSKELIAFFKALVTGNPVFYLYADKDAFLVPILKRRLGLKRLKIYGTLHWPIEISHDFSFYKHNLASEFNGIITLSSSLKQLGYAQMEVIPHGINLEFWKNIFNNDPLNLYLVIGISNRDHEKQIVVINAIKTIDQNAQFILISRNKKVIALYQNLSNLKIIDRYVLDDELKQMYAQAKGVILIQNYCYASNVVLESMAMKVPLITNKIGDIEEYLGQDYLMYVDEENMNLKLELFCNSQSFRADIRNYLDNLRQKFDWKTIGDKTLSYILSN